MMKVIKLKLLESKTDTFTKIIFWAACTLIWNGSFRAHEALTKLQLEFDSQTTLLYIDIQILSESINQEERTLFRI